MKFKVNELTNELMHHGVQGMKWGIRRYQPYGSGGYDPENAGKFVGKATKREQKKRTRPLLNPISDTTPAIEWARNSLRQKLIKKLAPLLKEPKCSEERLIKRKEHMRFQGIAKRIAQIRFQKKKRKQMNDFIRIS